MAMKERSVEFWSSAMMDAIDRSARIMTRRGMGEYDDLFQEACVAVLAFGSKTGASAVNEGYLVKMVRNSMRNLNQRDRRKGPTKPERGMFFEGDHAAPLIDSDLMTDVREAVASLPSPHREALEAGAEGRDPSLSIRAAQRLAKGARDAVRPRLESGYGRNVRRARSTPPRKSYLRSAVNHYTDWSKWGPIPNQRDD